MDSGTAAAIKEAGLTGKVFLATSGGGEQKGACEQVKSGAFDLDLSYDVPTQASNMAATIKWLPQSPGKTGTAKGSTYTHADPDHQGQRRHRRDLLEARQEPTSGRRRASWRGRGLHLCPAEAAGDERDRRRAPQARVAVSDPAPPPGGHASRSAGATG